MRAGLILPAVGLLLGTRLLGQGRWTPPQPPCDIAPGHFKVNGGVLYLKGAAEKPTQREQQLKQAHKVLTEAIVQDRQDKNAAAWYYLGRYYAEISDAAGADSAFGRALALAHQCKQDIDGHLERLWAATMNAGFAAWQEGREDSSVVMFRLAAPLQPHNPKPFLALARLYAGKEQHDSAVAYYRRTAAVAGSDTAFSKEKKEALGNAARLLVSRVQSSPGMQQHRRLRMRVDSIERSLENDSTVLARMVASSQSRKARGRRLAPADQQTFARDSAARAEAVGRAQAARATILQQVNGEGTKLQAVVAPALDALRAYLAVYPGELEAAAQLATLYAERRLEREAAAVFDTVAAHLESPDLDGLFTAGQRLMSQGLYRAGARALTLGLEKNPYRRDPLYALGMGYYRLRDSTGLLPVAQRLVALEPLNRTSIRLLAAAWQLRMQRDSTLKYLVQADSALAVEVVVSSFLPDSAGAAITLIATNLKTAASRPFRLTVECLDTRGHVIATETRDIPSIPPQDTRQIDLRVAGKGIAGWRYRAS